jgi:uncharacterized membrane protein YkvA (DUF1232 family)
MPPPDRRSPRPASPQARAARARRLLDLPLDLIPDFIPIVGRLDDAIIVALAIRTALRAANADLIRQHWPGPQPPPNGILRRAKGRTRSATAWGAASV